jgi:hypothetical protein
MYAPSPLIDAIARGFGLFGQQVFSPIACKLQHRTIRSRRARLALNSIFVDSTKRQSIVLLMFLNVV